MKGKDDFRSQRDFFYKNFLSKKLYLAHDNMYIDVVYFQIDKVLCFRL